MTALNHREPDRVPFFLMVTLLGARELDIPIEEYFSSAESVFAGETRLWERYGHDCVCNFFYAGAEAEAWGGETFFRDDGPPTTAMPAVTNIEDITKLTPPRVDESPRLMKVLKVTEMLSDKMAGEVPVLGVSMSPFSLPVMQLGFETYFEIMFERPDLFDRLMEINEEFCVEWSNAQLKAGANAIVYFDPVSSVTLIPRDQYLKMGHKVACRTLARIKGPTGTHMASGRCLPIIDDLASTGTSIVGVSCLEDLAEAKSACQGKLTVLGNLNGIEMRNWTPEQAEAAVKEAIAKAGPGGGFILSDNHGEIPWQVPEEVLMAVSEAVRKWGTYPLKCLQ